MRAARLSLVTSILLVFGLGCLCGGRRDQPPVDEADLARQRKLLPPPAEGCWDGIEGTWIGMAYTDAGWHRFTLRIERMLPHPKALTGEVVGHTWGGSESQTSPPSCGGGAHNYKALQHAEGSFDGEWLQFYGLDVYDKVEICPGAGDRRYYPDRFAGFVQAGGKEFHAINDDAHTAADTVLFVRAECDDRPALFRRLLD